MDERLVSSEADNHESVIEQSLRPQNLAQYIGQHKVKENLRVFIDAAKMRQETLDHVLLYGPPGLGKTTLASIVANEMGDSFTYRFLGFVRHSWLQLRIYLYSFSGVHIIFLLQDGFAQFT